MLRSIASSVETGVQSAQSQNLDNLKRKASPTRDYFKLLIYILCLIELALFFTALVFGRILGYRQTIIACFWFGIVVAGCAGLIVCANVAAIILRRLILTIKGSKGDHL
jgi:magnesium-transporting ATPase (P-type)